MKIKKDEMAGKRMGDSLAEGLKPVEGGSRVPKACR